MRILVFRTGRLQEPLRQKHGDFDEMFQRIWRRPGDQWSTWDCVNEPVPAHLIEHDAVIITGSAADAHGDDPWLAPCKAAIIRCYEAGIKILGVCFGHQIVAWALGGSSGPNPKGWELAMHPIQLNEEGRALVGDQANMFVLDFHRDHVLSLPPGATCLAASSHTPVHMYHLGRRVLCLQSHPEFDKVLVAEMVREYAESRGFTSAQVNEALASLKTEDNHQPVQALVERFLREW